MTDQTEHRGWETEADYHEHFLDDPSVDIADAGYGSLAIPISLILVLILFGTGFWFLRQYSEPPVVKFILPTPRLVQEHGPLNLSNGGTGSSPAHPRKDGTDFLVFSCGLPIGQRTASCWTGKRKLSPRTGRLLRAKIRIEYYREGKKGT